MAMKIDLEQKVIEYAKSLGIFSFDKLAIGVSGGADSMCLAYIFAKHFPLVIVHINHNLRQTANVDEHFVKDYAKKINAKFYSKTVDLSGNKDGIENEGRKKRYAFFREIAELESCPVLTAHNMTDSSESIIMHFLRGTSPSSVKPIESSTFIESTQFFRPLSIVTKQEILEFCKENNIEYREDETNSDTKYFRNFIRHEILPKFGEQPVINFADTLKEENDFLTILATQNADKVSNVHEFNKLHIALRRRIINLLVQSLTEKTVTKTHIDAVIKMCEKNIGKKEIILPGNITARLIDKKLVIE